MFQTDISGEFHEVFAPEELITTAVQLAYDKYTKAIQGIMDDLLRLGEINKVESRNVVLEGTLFKINFGIVYIPDGDILDCVTLVLENLAKVFEVKSVVCDCCQEKDTSKNTVNIYLLLY